MKLRGPENKARFALALFVLALLLTIGLSLALYSQARRELAAQRRSQTKTEAALLATLVSREVATLSDTQLREHLYRHGLEAAAGVFATDGTAIARASSIEHAPDWQQLFAAAKGLGRPGSDGLPPPRMIELSDSGFDVAEQFLSESYFLLLAKPTGAASSPMTFYIFSYQLVTLVVGVALVLLLVRWLFRPYRRMVEAARGSPVRAPSSRSESEFVVETFQALIDQLQAKERELAALHDLERRRADRSERFSERLISSIPSGLVSIDSSGLVTSANAQTMVIFGPAESGIGGSPARGDSGRLQPVGIDYNTFFGSAPKMVEMISECLTGGAYFRREEADVVNTDGFERHLGLSISPIVDASGNVEGALCLMTDITEVIDLRERMKLQENLANLGEMAAGLAHEFKNSLATIHGYIQLVEAQATATSDERRATLAGTLNEVRLLARLVTDFLNFARPQQLTVTSVDMSRLIGDCVDEVRPKMSNAGIEIDVKGDFVELTGDESMMRRAFVNLLRNAAEAIDQQSPRKLIAVTGSVDPGLNPRYAHVRIRDTGGGISPEDLAKIFIPFFTTKSRGYGIGLAIVQKIIVAHGGDVAVEHSDGSGTVFHCRLPLQGP